MTEPDTIPPRPVNSTTAQTLILSSQHTSLHVEGDIHIAQRSWLRDAMDARGYDLLGAMCVIGFAVVLGAGTAVALMIYSGSIVRRLLGDA